MVVMHVELVEIKMQVEIDNKNCNANMTYLSIFKYQVSVVISKFNWSLNLKQLMKRLLSSE